MTPIIGPRPAAVACGAANGVAAGAKCLAIGQVTRPSAPVDEPPFVGCYAELGGVFGAMTPKATPAKKHSTAVAANNENEAAI